MGTIQTVMKTMQTNESHIGSHVQRLPTVEKFKLKSYCVKKIVNVFNPMLINIQDSGQKHHLRKFS